MEWDDGHAWDGVKRVPNPESILNFSSMTISEDTDMIKTAQIFLRGNS
jgi:hypothetical protein